MSDDGGNEAGVRGRPFEKGHSGNPAGRPRGSRNRVTSLVQALADGRTEAIAQKAAEMAEAGDPRMIELFLKQPLRQERPVTFDMPEILAAADAVKVTLSVLKEVSAGEMTLAEAERVMALVKLHLETLEARDFDQRICLLERTFRGQ